LPFLLQPSYAEDPEPQDEIGINERLGGHVPLELSFYDEEGIRNNLGELIDRPAIISLVYYICKNLCPTTLDGLSEVPGKLNPRAGRDYRVITISFDERDSPEAALNKKRDHIKAKGCTACHTTDGTPLIGPTFKGIFGRKSIVVTGGREREVIVDERYMRTSMLEPKADVVKGFPPVMPSHKGILTNEEIEAIIEYLKTLK
jgi:cytochrome c2